jgi:GT2 family glycosyltransferase
LALVVQRPSYGHAFGSGVSTGERAPSDPAQDAPVALITVILCTRARRGLLERCLDSLRSLHDPNHEIVLVENDTRPVAAPLAGGNVRWVHESRAGLAFARNRGIAEARGEIVIFVDDDCEVTEHWLADVRLAFGDPAVTCVTGRVIPASLARRSERWFERLASFDRGSERQRFTASGTEAVMPHEAGALGTGCNMAFRRDVFARVGDFDPALDTPRLIRGGGDLDMFARVLEGGEVADYVPTAVVRHHHRVTMRSLARQFFGYGVGLGALSLKYLIEGRADVRGILRSQGTLIRWSFRRREASRRSRLVGYTLPIVQLVGDLVGPLAYLVIRKRNARPASQ